MFRKIKCGDKEVGMLANAASPYIFKNVFHEDLLQKFTTAKENIDENIAEKMAFIFAKQAETEDISELMKLTINDFLSWLSGFDALDIFLQSEEIIDLYQSQKKSSSVPKEQGE